MATRGVKHHTFGVPDCTYVTLGFKLSFDVTVVLFSLTVQKIDMCNYKNTSYKEGVAYKSQIFLPS